MDANPAIVYEWILFVHTTSMSNAVDFVTKLQNAAKFEAFEAKRRLLSREAKALPSSRSRRPMWPSFRAQWKSSSQRSAYATPKQDGQSTRWCQGWTVGNIIHKSWLGQGDSMRSDSDQVYLTAKPTLNGSATAVTKTCNLKPVDPRTHVAIVNFHINLGAANSDMVLEVDFTIRFRRPSKATLLKPLPHGL